MVESHLERALELLEGVSKPLEEHFEGIEMARQQAESAAQRDETRREIVEYLETRPKGSATVLTICQILRKDREDVEEALTQLASAGRVGFSPGGRKVSLISNFGIEEKDTGHEGQSP